MMNFDEQRLREINAAARTPGEILGQAEPGMLSGVVSEVPRGVARGAAKVQGALTSIAGQAYQPALDALESATGVKSLNPFDPLTRASDEAVRQYAPDPLTTGTAGQVVNGVADVLTQVGLGTGLFAAGGASGVSLAYGGAATAGAATGRSRFQELREQGVDADTAANAAFVDAVTTGGGVLVPGAIGYSGIAAPAAALGVRTGARAYLGANVAYGAATNMAMGIGQRASTYEILKGAGYDAMAEQYRPLDGAALAAEGILGGVFGAVGSAAGLPQRATATVDAAMAARDAAHATIGTAPGVPAEPATANAHRSAMERILAADAEGRAPDVGPTGVQDQPFVPRASNPAPVRQALGYYADELPAGERFLPSQRVATLDLTARRALRFDAPELNEYAASVEQQYGLPPGLLNALKNAGERSNSNQVSPAGARGVMQFMPENLRKYGVSDATDPLQMIDAAGRYLRDTMRQYGGDIDAMIADYNGGPRQAREVLAGRQPRAKETREYLARVREYLGRDTWASRGPADEGTPFQRFPAEQARAAANIEQEIGAVEAERADLLASDGQAADLGEVSAVRAELVDLTAQRGQYAAGAIPRQRAKEIQAEAPRTSYKQALSQANREIRATVQDLDSRIARLNGFLENNQTAAQAAQRLADLDMRLADLEKNRAAIEAPAARSAPIAAAVQEMTAQRAGQTTIPDATPVPGTVAEPGAGPAARTESGGRGAQEVEGAPRIGVTEPGSAAEPAGRSSQPGAGESAPVDLETQAGLARLDEVGDIRVREEDADGNVREVSLRDQLNEVQAEQAYGRPEGFRAAVACFLRLGA
ncbi:lytic transglycosylase domain-containing protein [Achromobacter insolitus]|uniref:lytic transglycosylase domain-containing protein n=1 Tax=Achromobacter insolitus TaxID=217204 RepID=UPI0011B0A522|nr:lytic transglycosylase domain-containing protein [Achromobacter insolitus]